MGVYLQRFSSISSRENPCGLPPRDIAWWADHGGLIWRWLCVWGAQPVALASLSRGKLPQPHSQLSPLPVWGWSTPLRCPYPSCQPMGGFFGHLWLKVPFSGSLQFNPGDCFPLSLYFQSGSGKRCMMYARTLLPPCLLSLGCGYCVPNWNVDSAVTYMLKVCFLFLYVLKHF